MTRGYYSLIQFVPNLARREAANVGVVVFVEGEAPAIMFSDENDGPKLRFGASTINEHHLNFEKTAIKLRLKEVLGDHSRREAFEAFVSTRANRLLLTPPKVVGVEASVMTLATELYQELVHVDHPSRKRLHKPKLDSLLEFLDTRNIPYAPAKQVVVPVSETCLKSEFSYLNGCLNIVVSQAFSQKHGDAIETAQKLAAQGQLLSNHPLGKYHRKLVVVGQFGSEHTAEHSAQLFKEFSVDLVKNGKKELDAFRDKIVFEAKQLPAELLS